MRLGYARCSTEEQDGALQAQIARLKEAGCDRVISELVSGRRNDRPGILEAMTLVKKGRVKELLITRIDRLGRDAAHADELIALCSIQGVKVRALDGGEVDPASPQGFLMARLLTTMAEVESRMLSQRITRQFETYRMEGRHLRRRAPFGYTKANKQRLEPHPEEWVMAKRIIDELEEYGSFSKVAFRMPEWCHWTPAACNLQAWFVNPILRGHVPHKHVRASGKGWKSTWEIIHRDQHEPLIDELRWENLRIQLQQTYNHFANKNIRDPQHGFTGLLRCANCGTRMRRNTSVGVAWWRCRHRLCKNRGGVREDILMPIAVRECVKAARHLAEIAAMPPEDNPEVLVKQRDLEDLKLMALRNPVLQQSVKDMELEIEMLKIRKGPQVDLEIYEQFMLAPGFFEEASPEEQRALFSGVIQEIQIGRRGDPIRVVPRSF